ncbi:hypothetical protein [Sediminicola sp. YIK13]|uniref:hypothetical protein n=1 Tax=Sediminicola sp. YIK13 TaxID=1453352 RepID=UPI00119D0D67|nr:hypothetical protein [Sediminicola sp. YIK13]
MKQLFFLWLLACFCSYSQTMDIGNFHPLKKVLLNEGTSELYLFQPDSVYIVKLDKQKKVRKIPLLVPEENFIYDFHPISIGDNIYFVEYKGGRLFEYTDNKFIRKDRSFTHKMQINSTVFVHKDSIYRYGGYGFWSQRNFFTYYDKPSSEWQMVAPSSSKILPKGTQDSWVTNVEDDIYIFGGIAMDDYNPEQFYPSHKVFKFNTNAASWQELGDGNIDLSRFSKSIPFGNKHIYLDDKDDNIYVVDIIDNTLKLYKKTSVNNNIVALLNSYYFKGAFYCFIWNPQQPNHFQLTVIPEEEFFGDLISEREFYDTNTAHSSVLLGVLSTLGISLLLFLTRRWYLGRNKITVSLKGLSYKNNKFDMDENSIAAINLLLRSDDEVNSKELMDLVENKNLNFAHNTKIKNKLIAEINFKLRTVLGIKADPITFQKSKIDKRIKTYSIERRYFLIR